MVRTSLAAAALGLGLVAGCGGQSERLTLAVIPTLGLVDAPFRVQAAGAEPGTPVTFTVRGRSHEERSWSLTRTMTADSGGGVDWQRAYLIADLRPEKPPASDDYLPLAQDLTITVRSGKASATTHARWNGSSSVEVEDERLEGSGFYGEWYVPRGAHRQRPCS